MENYVFYAIKLQILNVNFTDDTDTELTLETAQGMCPDRPVLEIAFIRIYNYNYMVYIYIIYIIC